MADEGGGARPGALSVLRAPAYRLLFLGSTALYLAVHAQAIARGWLARDLTGSNTGLGGVFLAFGLAMLVTSPFAGVAADRFPKRTVLTLALLLLPRGAARPTGAMRSPLRQLGDAVRYVRGRHDLRALVLCSFGVVVIGFPYIAFLPSIADLFGEGSLGYGLLSTASAAGAVAAGVAVTRRRPRNPWRLVSVCGAVFGASLVLLSLAPSFLGALLVLIAVGGATLVFQTTNQALVLSLGAEEFHGRIQGLVMLGFSGFGIAALPLGLVADAVGIRQTFAAMGLATLAVSAAFWRSTGRYRVQPTTGRQIVDLG